MAHESFIAFALLAATSSLAGVIAYIYSLKRQTYLLLWTAGWSLFALHYLSPALSQWVPSSALQNGLNRWLFGLAGLFFFLGAQMYAQTKPWIVRCSVAAGILAAAAVGNLLSVVGPGTIVVPSALLFVAVEAATETATSSAGRRSERWHRAGRTSAVPGPQACRRERTRQTIRPSATGDLGS